MRWGREGGGGGGEGAYVGCHLKFHYFVARLSVTIFDLCRLSVDPSYFFDASR